MVAETTEPLVSFIIPLLNEQDSLRTLHARIGEQMRVLKIEHYELIFINDGSTDDSEAILNALHAEDACVSVIHFRRNFGKAAALDAGFNQSRGDVIITMDADLQDDPAEISAFLAKLDEGYDMVSGWKKVRHDPLSKTLPSKLFNLTLSLVSGLRLHDFNCGFKAYRREAAQAIDVYGELHRYIPILVHWRGFRVTEIPVQHHPRRHGTSKYGIERILRGLFDCLTIILLTRYESRPLHLFGAVGLGVGSTGGSILLYLTILWFQGEAIGGRPLLFLGVLLMLVGMQLMSTGLVTEMLTRQNNQMRKVYTIRQLRAAGQEAKPARRLLPVQVAEVVMSGSAVDDGQGPEVEGGESGLEEGAREGKPAEATQVAASAARGH